MAVSPTDRDLRVALRMKAARWLAGRADDKGKPIALPVSELAEDPLLAQNRISRNRLEEIEQMRVTARPMELEKIAAALGMPSDWFATEAELLEASERDLEELVQQERPDDETDEPGQADTGPRGGRR